MGRSRCYTCRAKLTFDGMSYYCSFCYDKEDSQFHCCQCKVSCFKLETDCYRGDRYIEFEKCEICRKDICKYCVLNRGRYDPEYYCKKCDIQERLQKFTPEEQEIINRFLDNDTNFSDDDTNFSDDDTNL